MGNKKSYRSGIPLGAEIPLKYLHKYREGKKIQSHLAGEPIKEGVVQGKKKWHATSDQA